MGFAFTLRRKCASFLLMGRKYTIAAGHPLTAEAGGHAFRCGGNAFDATLAAWLSACLAEPVLTSPGGGGFAMVSPAQGEPRLYDFFSQTPRRADPSARSYPLEADFGSTKQVFHLGAGTVATPGCVAGILKLHADFGRLPFAECAAPAMDLSRNGLIITDHAETLLRVVTDLYLATPESGRLFGSRREPGGCLRAGERFFNRDFAQFLEMLESEGTRWFYQGDIGRIIGDYCEENGGHLRREDFQHYTVHVREPLKLRHRGATVWLNPPPSMGGTLIGLGLKAGQYANGRPFPFQRREDWADWIRPLRLMTLLRARAGMQLLDAADHSLVNGILSREPELAEAVIERFPHMAGLVQTRGTTQISVMDEEGNEVAMTTSNGAGSAIIPAGAGFMLNNMLGEEDLQPEGLHTWKPDSRLSSMMSPCIAHLADGRRIVTGSGGSNRIRSTVLQILRHVIERDSPLPETLQAPRLHWENGQVHAEEEAAGALEGPEPALPWPVIRHEMPNLFFGGAHSVLRLRDGHMEGGGDPRRGGVSLAG